MLLTLSGYAQPSYDYSKAEVLADLRTLRSSLIETHYDVYAYTNQAKFDSAYREVEAAISQDSLSRLETVTLYQRFISVINVGHTNIDFPGQSYGQYASAGGTVFPLEIAFEYGKPLVRKNWSGNPAIEIGSEVLSINGKTMPEVLAQIYPLVSAERPYFKNAKIELYAFPRYYWQAFGQQEAYEVVIRSEGRVQSYLLPAIDLLEEFETPRNEVLNATMHLQFFEQAAYLNPGHFSGDIAVYQQFIDSAFTKIKTEQSQNLIIDLRNNGGGNDAFSDYLVSYFATKPFLWNSRFTLKTSAFLKAFVKTHYDTTEAFWQSVLTHADGEVYEYAFEPYKPQPPAKQFTGAVYVLVNRQSHSQAAVTAAQIQDYQFGTIVGEETGDYPSLYASIFQFPLPETNIAVNVSKGYIVRVNGSTKAEGVMPDLVIKDYLLDEEDEILEGLLEQLKK